MTNMSRYVLLSLLLVAMVAISSAVSGTSSQYYALGCRPRPTAIAVCSGTPTCSTVSHAAATFTPNQSSIHADQITGQNVVVASLEVPHHPFRQPTLEVPHHPFRQPPLRPVHHAVRPPLHYPLRALLVTNSCYFPSWLPPKQKKNNIKLLTLVI
ncbi:hypothetical protein PtA15_17A338 [Puccinia triticina]|uniref:Uncharacterized protein n=1 Tax=Puccinia triticina TaxID=208348 RepID=A0ABY7D5D6_9BASI|nr:uncharacterized protein PtA15_17A338 [Puccinia triticina]WAQ92856.1 hypothetical protein PtA15_17A338 [Puccinia triticina]